MGLCISCIIVAAWHVVNSVCHYTIVALCQPCFMGPYQLCMSCIVTVVTVMYYCCCLVTMLRAGLVDSVCHVLLLLSGVWPCRQYMSCCSLATMLQAGLTNSVYHVLSWLSCTIVDVW